MTVSSEKTTIETALDIYLHVLNGKEWKKGPGFWPERNFGSFQTTDRGGETVAAIVTAMQVKIVCTDWVTLNSLGQRS